MSITTEIILKLTAGSSTTQFLTYAAKVIEAAERMQPKVQEFDVECVTQRQKMHILHVSGAQVCQDTRDFGLP